MSPGHLVPHSWSFRTAEMGYAHVNGWRSPSELLSFRRWEMASLPPDSLSFRLGMMNLVFGKAYWDSIESCTEELPVLSKRILPFSFSHAGLRREHPSLRLVFNSNISNTQPRKKKWPSLQASSSIYKCWLDIPRRKTLANLKLRKRTFPWRPRWVSSKAASSHGVLGFCSVFNKNTSPRHASWILVAWVICSPQFYKSLALPSFLKTYQVGPINYFTSYTALGVSGL